MTLSSHHSSASISDTWFTPPALIEALGGAESFDLDPCTVADRPWPTAREHFTAEDNGLTRKWWGRVWMNPPYSLTLIRRFLARMAEHNCGVALISARTETDHFFRYVWESASGLLFLRGRLFFGVGEDGYYGQGTARAYLRRGEPAPFNAGVPSVLVAYGPADREILAASPIDGHFVPLRLEPAYLVAALDQSWCAAVRDWLRCRGGPATLSEIYRAFALHPKVRHNRNWRAKIRQSLQRGAGERVEQGVWRVREATP